MININIQKTHNKYKRNLNYKVVTKSHSQIVLFEYCLKTT